MPTKERRGRKKVEDKKMQVSNYIRRSRIERLGGMDEVKSMVNKYIEDQYNIRVKKNL